jgi:hypothetical protein
VLLNILLVHFLFSTFLNLNPPCGTYFSSNFTVNGSYPGIHPKQNPFINGRVPVFLLGKSCGVAYPGLVGTLGIGVAYVVRKGGLGRLKTDSSVVSNKII